MSKVSESISSDVKYILANQVSLVRGVAGALLYDLYLGRLQPISLDLAAIIESDSNHRRVPDGMGSKNLLQELSRRGYLAKKNNARDEYAQNWKNPSSPLLRTISFDARFDINEAVASRLQSWLLEASGRLGLINFIVLCRSQDERRIRKTFSKLIAPTPSVVLETLVDCDAIYAKPPGAEPASRIERASKNRVLPTSAKLLKEHLIVNYWYYHQLRFFSESFGCIHFDNLLNAYPDLAESHVSFDASEMTISQIIEKAEVREYWLMGKTTRDTCSQCQYRYACPNTKGSRSNTERWQSSPSNCTFNVSEAVWNSCD